MLNVKHAVWIIIICLFIPSGCEDINPRLATEAVRDAIKAITLSDEEIIQLPEEAGDFGQQSFLSSHPEPGKRAERLKTGIESPEKLAEKGVLEKAWAMLSKTVSWVIENVVKIIAYVF